MAGFASNSQKYTGRLPAGQWTIEIVTGLRARPYFMTEAVSCRMMTLFSIVSPALLR